MPKFLALNNVGQFQEIATTATSTGVGDAGKAVELDAGGKLATSLLPTGSLTSPRSIVASEALAAGDFVSIWSNAGTENCRKANGSTANAGRLAHGFVLAATASGTTAQVYPVGGINSGLFGLTPGSYIFLSGATAGGWTGAPPSSAGFSVQSLGVALSATDVLFSPEFRGIRA